MTGARRWKPRSDRAGHRRNRSNRPRLARRPVDPGADHNGARGSANGSRPADVAHAPSECRDRGALVGTADRQAVSTRRSRIEIDASVPRTAASWKRRSASIDASLTTQSLALREHLLKLGVLRDNLDIAELRSSLRSASMVRSSGRVVRACGTMLEVTGLVGTNWRTVPLARRANGAARRSCRAASKIVRC